MEVLASLFEHLSQHVVVFVHLDELFPNDLPKTLSFRRQTTKAVMHGGYRRDALSHRSVHSEHQVRRVAEVRRIFRAFVACKIYRTVLASASLTTSRLSLNCLSVRIAFSPAPSGPQ
jgi:hypothetical protein